MQNDPGQTWAVGAIANGHVLTRLAGWVPLDVEANPAGPWWPGDVLNGHAFTGEVWVALPTGFEQGPTGDHQRSPTSGHRFEDPIMQVVDPPPIYPQAPPARTFSEVFRLISRVITIVYCGGWLFVAVDSAVTAKRENSPLDLASTFTALLNIVLFITGKTRAELGKGFVATVKVMLPFVLCGAIAAGGVWLSLQLNEPQVLVWTLFVTVVGLAISWVFRW